MWSSYLNSDIGDSTVITNLLVGIAYIVISFAVRFTKVTRLEYRDPFAVCMLGVGVQSILRILNTPPLIQTSMDTLVTMVAVAVAFVLIRDKSIR